MVFDQRSIVGRYVRERAGGEPFRLAGRHGANGDDVRRPELDDGSIGREPPRRIRNDRRESRSQRRVTVTGRLV